MCSPSPNSISMIVIRLQRQGPTKGVREKTMKNKNANNILKKESELKNVNWLRRMMQPQPEKGGDKKQSTILKQNSGKLRDHRHQWTQKAVNREAGWDLENPLPAVAWPKQDISLLWRSNRTVPKKTDEFQPNHTKERPTVVQPSPINRHKFQ